MWDSVVCKARYALYVVDVTRRGSRFFHADVCVRRMSRRLALGRIRARGDGEGGREEDSTIFEREIWGHVADFSRELHKSLSRKRNTNLTSASHRCFIQ